MIVPGPGELELAGSRKTKPSSKRARGAGEVKLPIKPERKAKRKLNRKGSLKVKAGVEFTPDGGEKNAKTKKLKLVKR